MAGAREVILDSDIVKLYTVPSAGEKKRLIAVLFWGDRVRITRRTKDGFVVRLPRNEWSDDTRSYKEVVYECLLPKKVRFREAALLKMRFVDVGQGDGAILETPSGQVILIDGGESSHIRRYLTQAYSHILHTKSLGCSAIVVTHGDADHFAGLTDLATAKRPRDRTSPMICADRIIHNGLVKQTSTSLGSSVKVGGRKFVTALFDDLRDVPDTKMNPTFRRWKAALKALKTTKGGKPRVSRTAHGRDKDFDFLENDGIRVSVLGPILERHHGKDVLPWLGDAGKTINGHSVVLKVTYHNVRFLLGADLNTPSEERLLETVRESGASLTAEVLKVPHHGSADFSPRMLEAVRPVVSVVSSGDENTAKEYIHPRAGLVGALGRFSRGTVDKPLVYVTEMVAFFKRRKGSFREYTKTVFGIVHVRTDGARVLVVTNSGKDDKKEAYAFRVDDRGDILFEPDVKPI